jgi:hypothetical protein
MMDINNKTCLCLFCMKQKPWNEVDGCQNCHITFRKDCGDCGCPSTKKY